MYCKLIVGSACGTDSSGSLPVTLPISFFHFLLQLFYSFPGPTKQNLGTQTWRRSEGLPQMTRRQALSAAAGKQPLPSPPLPLLLCFSPCSDVTAITCTRH